MGKEDRKQRTVTRLRISIGARAPSIGMVSVDRPDQPGQVVGERSITVFRDADIRAAASLEDTVAAASEDAPGETLGHAGFAVQVPLVAILARVDGAVAADQRMAEVGAASNQVGGAGVEICAAGAQVSLRHEEIAVAGCETPVARSEAGLSAGKDAVAGIQAKAARRQARVAAGDVVVAGHQARVASLNTLR